MREYKCIDCGATNCKLWRDGGVFFIESVELRCAYCTGKNQKKNISSLDARGFRDLAFDRDGQKGLTDQIGWYVPAVPSPLGFWGYSSVPEEAVERWRAMPTFPGPQIASHCLPGGWRNLEGDWMPKCPWPSDTYVQWGGNGLVLVREGDNYRTAFFEAFPQNPGTFIRGEGRNVEEAEASAWKKYEKIIACPGHEFEKRGYTNGLGFCKHCNMSKSSAFEPEEQPATILPDEPEYPLMSEEEFNDALKSVFDHILKKEDKDVVGD